MSTQRHPPTFSPARTVVAVLLVLAFPLSLARPAVAQITQQGARPTHSYFAAFRPYYDGDYGDALRAFQFETRGAIRDPVSRWIDSICYYTMTGECYYQMGKFPQALENYDEALRLYVAFHDWLIPVQFKPITPALPQQQVQVPWGSSQRRSRIGNFPATSLIAQGRLDHLETLKRGGVVKPAMLFPIRPQEIVRCTALAIARRHQLLGPVAAYDPLTREVEAVAIRRRGQPNHWSEVFLDVQLGLAYRAAGKNLQAKGVLERAVLAEGEYDHPMTGMVLLELGRIAADEGDYPTAGNYFLEATYAAAQFDDASVMDEAFSEGFLAHLVTNHGKMYPPLEPALNWARAKNLRQLQASLSILLAENLAIVQNQQAAQSMITTARNALGRRDMVNGRLGARLNYVTALVAYQSGNASAGGQALSAALQYMRSGGSPKLFQISHADVLYTRGNLSSRSAMALYEELLPDPTPHDWTFDPLESLTLLLTPQIGSLENWFETSLERREHEKALEIADLVRRHRFYSTLPLGGRLLGLRSVVDGPEEVLDPVTRLQRQDLLTRFPNYRKLAQQSAALQAELVRMPLVAQDADALRAQKERLQKLAETSAAQERLLHEMAVSRVPGGLVFPPLRKVAEVREALPPGTVVATFFNTRQYVHGFLLSAEGLTHWTVGTPAEVRKGVQIVLRDMGNLDGNRRFDLGLLASDDWKRSAQQMLRMLFEGSRTDFVKNYQELAIVPDGVLWYLPFEALQVGDVDNSESLVSLMRVRFAPTLSLAAPDGRPRKVRGNTAVVLGRLYPRDEETTVRSEFAMLQQIVPDAVALDASLPTEANLYVSLIDRLYVFDDITSSGDGPYAWSPIQLPPNPRASTIDTWLNLPLAGPDLVVLPGFHTAAENGLKTVDREMEGQHVFLSVCGLMATGARTVLLSRWRTGGQTSYELVREFARELPHTTAADAWQRSIEFVWNQEINPGAEPRVDVGNAGSAPKSDHPFFWAGYLLIDSGAPSRGEDEDPAAGIFGRLQEE